MTPGDFRCPPDHKHGQNHTCYNAHKCRCPGCRKFVNQGARRRTRLRAYGKWEDFLVPAIGTRRRLQALVAVGWSQTKLGARLGTSQSAIWALLYDTGSTVRRSSFDRVSTLYEQLWNTPPALETCFDVSAYKRSIHYAAVRGWQPPLAWDDIDTDFEPAPRSGEEFVDEILVQNVCNGQPGRLNYPERIEAVRILNGRDLSDAKIAAVLKLDTRSVFRIRGRAGIPAAVGADGLPIAS